jgi:hypothetical protein
MPRTTELHRERHTQRDEYERQHVRSPSAENVRIVRSPRKLG